MTNTYKPITRAQPLPDSEERTARLCHIFAQHSYQLTYLTKFYYRHSHISFPTSKRENSENYLDYVYFLLFLSITAVFCFCIRTPY